MHATIAFTILAASALLCSNPDNASPLEKAFESAAKDKHIVVAVFVKPGDKEGEKYASDTLLAKDVKDWQAKNAVLCMLSVDAYADDAKEYCVEKHPTTFFLNSEKQFLARIEGRCDAAAFLKTAKSAVDGTTEAAKARAAAAKDDHDMDARYDFARTLSREGAYGEASREFLWLFDHVLEYRESYYGVRLSFMLSEIIDIGKHYPPALKGLRNRRDAAEKAIFAGTGSFEQAMDFTSLNDHLGENDRTLAAYKKVKGNNDVSESVRSYLAKESADLFRDRKQYKEAREAFGDLEVLCNERCETFDELGPRPDQDEKMKAMIEEARRSSLLRELSGYVEVACGCEDVEVAQTIAKALIDKIKDGESYAALIRAAVRADAHKFADSIRGQGTKACTEKKDLDAISEAAKSIDKSKIK